MAGFTYTYVLTNGTSADADEVQQNFNDAKNGVQDGTKDIAVAAFSAAGAATFAGHVTLGNATNDDITVTGSLASSIPIKTTFSYDIGTSIVGLKDIYLGSADSAARTTKIRGATVASSWTLTTPTSGGSAGQFLATDSSGTTSWMDGGPGLAMNYSISASVAANALTISVKGADGAALSATNFARFAFRNSTAATGTPVVRSATSISDLVISSGSTLGHTSAVAEYIYVGLLDNAGTLELTASTIPPDEGTLVTSTAEGGAGAADSRHLVYSTTARASFPWRLIARLKSTQATAGTYATAISEISLPPFKAGGAVVSASCGAYSQTSSTLTNVTNLEVVITTTGHPVRLWLISDNSGNFSSFFCNAATALNMAFTRDASIIADANSTSLRAPPGAMSHTDFVAAGTYTYRLQAKSFDNTNTVSVNYMKLVAETY